MSADMEIMFSVQDSAGNKCVMVLVIWFIVGCRKYTPRSILERQCMSNKFFR